MVADDEPQSPGGGEVPEAGGYSLDTLVGNMALSKVGKTFAKYVEVLLEPGLENAQMEDVEKLIEGIRSTEFGGEIEAMPMSDGNQSIPQSDEVEWTPMSDGVGMMPMSDAAIKVEDESD